jgi:hypothetical protein
VALQADDERIVVGLQHSMGEQVFTYPQLAQNVRAKLQDSDYASALQALVTTTPDPSTLT